MKTVELFLLLVAREILVTRVDIFHFKVCLELNRKASISKQDETLLAWQLKTYSLLVTKEISVLVNMNLKLKNIKIR